MDIKYFILRSLAISMTDILTEYEFTLEEITEINKSIIKTMKKHEDEISPAYKLSCELKMLVDAFYDKFKMDTKIIINKQEKIEQQNEKLTLTNRDRDAFLEALSNPPKPGRALKNHKK